MCTYSKYTYPGKTLVVPSFDEKELLRGKALVVQPFDDGEELQRGRFRSALSIPLTIELPELLVVCVPGSSVLASVSAPHEGGAGKN